MSIVRVSYIGPVRIYLYNSLEKVLQRRLYIYE